MAAKSFKTSKAPSNKIKGGLDAITSGGLYAVPSGKGRRQHKKKKQALNPVGGLEVVRNDWRKRVSEIKGIDHHGREFKHTVVLWGATVLKDNVEANYETTVSGKKIVLGKEDTYTQQMIACKYEQETKNPTPNNGVHKVKANASGYMEKHRTNGRRVMRNNCNLINP